MIFPFPIFLISYRATSISILHLKDEHQKEAITEMECTTIYGKLYNENDFLVCNNVCIHQGNKLQDTHLV